MNQLRYPTDVIVDHKTDSLIICDSWNRRVVRWPRRNGANGQIIISDIACRYLTMDDNGDLYVSDSTKNEVRRWKIGDNQGTIVEGGNREKNQLDCPSYFFVDED
jgi:sugar lactone lactonase YvrE